LLLEQEIDIKICTTIVAGCTLLIPASSFSDLAATSNVPFIETDSFSAVEQTVTSPVAAEDSLMPIKAPQVSDLRKDKQAEGITFRTPKFGFQHGVLARGYAPHSISDISLTPVKETPVKIPGITPDAGVGLIDAGSVRRIQIVLVGIASLLGLG